MPKPYMTRETKNWVGYINRLYNAVNYETHGKYTDKKKRQKRAKE